ncbi:MAG: TIGR01244 family phosphatase [Acidimicrobiales bacterium]|nr:TIGR01244 family phosphatase [Hyphomonadaceae bacterium]RZV41146.1 MAG: TIGR01244 family phosphatase [Acidimicrobiales bacterium]
MNTTALHDDFHITQQIDHTDLESIANRGFKTIINNRPDNEQAGQPLSANLEKEALRTGLKYHHIPIIPGRATPADVEAFRKALEESQGPVLAFCKSGMRAKSMYTACRPNQSGFLSSLFRRK